MAFVWGTVRRWAYVGWNLPFVPKFICLCFIIGIILEIGITEGKKIWFIILMHVVRNLFAMYISMRIWLNKRTILTLVCKEKDLTNEEK